MRSLEEIAKEAANRVGNLPPSVEFNHVAYGIIRSALTEAEQVALKTAIQENESLHQSIIASEAQVARLREALQHIDRVASMHTKGGMAQAQRTARAALSPK